MQTGAPKVRSSGLSMQVTTAEFRAVSSLVQEHFGIHLPDSKRAMLSCRMYREVRATGCASFAEYFRKHLAEPTPDALSKLANALSTNHTYFNREAGHFDYLREEILPELIRRQRASRSRDLRVWCAAASSGEEPYTLAMLIREALRGQAGSWQGGLLATDISMNALATARAGVYPTEAVKELPPALVDRYFRSTGDGFSEVVPPLKDDVTFRRFNLMNQRYPFKRPFHVIFCRNVMIYFEEHTKKKVVERLYESTAPGGVLFVGLAETISGLGSSLSLIHI